MNQTVWKDRGWWMSVEINKKPIGKRKHTDALNLLETAHERYDLMLESGITIARGIFTQKSDMCNLAKLLEMVNPWKDTAVFAQGRRLSRREAAHFSKYLICAADITSSQCKSAERGLDYIGCHLMKIGLMNYSLAALKNGATYWFSSFIPDSDSNGKFSLDKNKLAHSMEISKLCPLYPTRTKAVLDRLPDSVNLCDNFHRQRWVLTKYRFRTSWPRRYPPIVPYSDSVYRHWMRNIFVGMDVKNGRD